MPKNIHYLNRVVPQHKKPKFLKWLDTNIQPFFDGETLLKAMDSLFDIENSEGVQLNVTGDIVGRNRTLSFDPADGSSPVLDDETYRILQKAKISMNQWDGTIPGVLELWENLFPQYELIIQDNQDMTMDLYVVGLVTPLEQELLRRGYIAPKPMGVLIRFTFIYESEPFEHTAHIAGMRHNAITINQMPPFVPDYHFRGAANSGGNAWGVSITQIPPYLPEIALEAISNVSGAGWSITQTILPKGG
jgi:hypothetical protein